MIFSFPLSSFKIRTSVSTLFFAPSDLKMDLSINFIATNLPVSNYIPKQTLAKAPKYKK